MKAIPRSNQPWTRLEQDGVSKMHDGELLAAVIGMGFRKENAVDLSNRVLASYDLPELANLTYLELKQQFKNDIHAKRVHAMFEIFRRTNKKIKMKSIEESKKIKTAEDVYNYFVDEIKDKKKEYFYVIMLNTKNRVIGKELISVGTLNASLIHPREVFNPAIKSSANSIILVHNHPSGDCIASQEDKNITKILSNAGDLLGIKVLDHIIIGFDNYSSINNKL
jgi:DNA repair protein RadC